MKNILINTEKTLIESRNYDYTFNWAKKDHSGNFEYFLYEADPVSDTVTKLILNEKTSENSIKISHNLLKAGNTYYLQVFSENIGNSCIWHDIYFKTVANFKAKVPSFYFLKPGNENHFYATYRFYNEMFAQNGNIYNPDLALLSAVASGCANSQDCKFTGYLNDFLSDLCFEDIEYYNGEKLSDSTETVEKSFFAICHRKIYANNRYYNLIGIITRGTVSGEWLDNFNVGTGNIHQGFNISAKEVLKALGEYTEKYSFTNPEDNKFWVCGYSRGAATANIISKYLKSEPYAKKDNIYGYTFGSPNVYMGDKETVNVFNIINSGDIIPIIPYWDMWNRYGTDIYSENMDRETLKKADTEFQTVACRKFANYSFKNVKTIRNELKKLAPTPEDYYNRKFSKSAKNDGITPFELIYNIYNLIIKPRFRDYLSIPNELIKILAIIVGLNFRQPKIFSSHSLEYYYSLTKAYNHSLKKTDGKIIEN